MIQIVIGLYFSFILLILGSPCPGLWRKDIIRAAQSLLQGEDLSSKFVIKEHIPFVNILDFSLVANHYHFYLASNTDNGVPLFMHKLNLGFAMYFNLKYERMGALFGSRYKSIPVKIEAQSYVVSNYVGIINPLDVYQPGWRNDGFNDLEKAFKFLESYEFSSFPDKIGKRKSKILAPKEIFERYFSRADIGNKNEYIQFVKDFLEQRLEDSRPLFLE